jgi:hypothetical protein
VDATEEGDLRGFGASGGTRARRRDHQDALLSFFLENDVTTDDIPYNVLGKAMDEGKEEECMAGAKRRSSDHAH